MAKHELYKASDFTAEEIDRGNQLAKAVCEGGLGVCKRCGAAEIELDQFKTCEEFNANKRNERKYRGTRSNEKS